jgi:hypothetical protein
MAGPQKVPPQAQVMQALFGFMVTKRFSAVAVHNMADALEDGPLYYADLARVTGTDKKALDRAMRVLSGVGILAEVEPGKFGLTPASDLLRSDVSGSMRDMAVMITSKSHWLPWGRMEDTLKSGISGPQHEFGTDIFS